jgi:hypothetical protein
MMSRTPFRLWLILALVCAASARAQQLIGYVNTRDAEVTGATDGFDGQAVLAGSVSVTAKDHTAPISLGRGGTVRVCQSTELHVTENRAVSVAAPLLFSLDRGAIEIQTAGTPNDAIMTPDLRFTVRSQGPLDLRLRVARNGDTCVDNRGPGAPTLAVSDPFGEAMYELSPNQHVLFEHGSLREVVDRETSPCGCPEPKGMSIADALVAPPSAKTGPKSAVPAPAPPPEQQHPFPVAVSEGLAPPEDVPPPPPGPHPPVTDALVYIAPASVIQDPDALPPQDQPNSSLQPPPAPAPPPVSQPGPPPGAQAALSAPASVPPPLPGPKSEPSPPTAAAAAQPPPKDLVHVIGRLFHKLFVHH